MKILLQLPYRALRRQQHDSFLKQRIVGGNARERSRDQGLGQDRQKRGAERNVKQTGGGGHAAF
jgi:hypothetical protein